MLQHLLNSFDSLRPVPTLTASTTDGISVIHRGRARPEPVLVAECLSAPEVDRFHNVVTALQVGFHITPSTSKSVLEADLSAMPPALAELRERAAAGDACTAVTIDRYFTAVPDVRLPTTNVLDEWQGHMLGMLYGSAPARLIPFADHAHVLQHRLNSSAGTYLRSHLTDLASVDRMASVNDVLQVVIDAYSHEFWLWLTLTPAEQRDTWSAHVDLWLPTPLDRKDKRLVAQLQRFGHFEYLRAGAVAPSRRKSGSQPAIQSAVLTSWLEAFYPTKLLPLRRAAAPRCLATPAGPVVYNALSEPSVLAVDDQILPYTKNGVIVGQPGSGMHYLASSLVSHHVAGGSPAWIIQAREDEIAAARAMNARVVDALQGLNPLADREAVMRAPDLLANWVLAIAGVHEPDDFKRSALEYAISVFAQWDKPLTLRTILSYMPGIELPAVQGVANELAERLSPFLEGGAYGNLFNGTPVDLGGSGLTVIPADAGSLPAEVKPLRDLTIALLLSQQWKKQPHTKVKLAYMRDYATDPGPVGRKVWTQILRGSRMDNGAWLHRLSCYEGAQHGEWAETLMNNAGWSAVLQMPETLPVAGVRRQAAALAPSLRTVPGKYSQFVYQGYWSERLSTIYTLPGCVR